MTHRKKGMEKQIIRAGNGPKPVPGQLVTVDCTGFGKNNDLTQTFWSTNDDMHKPFTFVIGEGNVIKGSPVILHNCISSVSYEPKSVVHKIQTLITTDKVKTVFNGRITPLKIGWDEGVLGMQRGEVARLKCPPDYAFGAEGFPAWGIQPNSVLEFEIELLYIE